VREGGEAGVVARGQAVFAGLAGSVLGAALQLQQAVLWPMVSYGLLLVAAWVAAWGLVRKRRGGTHARWWIALGVGACVGAGLAGVRAVTYADASLSPAVEGRA
jgi:competence protein ComEC